MNTSDYPAEQGLLVRRRLAAGLLGAILLLSGLLVFSPALSLFGQEDGAKRDAWQQPERVMDALGVRAGSRVADVGCGEGYFVMHLAKRVGGEGRVYAVDVDEDSLARVRRRAEKEGFANVEILRSRTDATLLPSESVEVVLVVNAYHEMREADAMLHSIREALKPGGLLAIIDPPGRAGDDRDAHRRAHTIAEEMVKDDAQRNGFEFLRREEGFHRPDSGRKDWFFLIFRRPPA
jgi:predicted methyltransferase